MPTPKPDAPAPGQPSAFPDGTVTVEAPTTQEAMTAVAERLGPRATIVRADRVLRGGVGGFFGKQMVQLTAAPAGVAAAGAEHGLADETAAADAEPAGWRAASTSPGEDVDGGDGLDATLRRLTADVDGREEAFGDALRRHLRVSQSTGETGPDGDGAPATAAPPAPPVPSSDTGRVPAAAAPTGAPPAAEGERRGAAPRWSAHELHRLRLPDRLIEQVVRQDPADDQAWLVALADAVDPLCRPLPAGDALLAGPRAVALGEQLGLPVWADRQREAPAVGPLAVAACDIPTDAAAVAAVRGDRWVHLLVSGPGRFDHLMRCDPLAVSWIGDAALPEALDLCTRFGLVLGYGADHVDAGRPPHRATPLDVAMTVRRMLPR